MAKSSICLLLLVCLGTSIAGAQVPSGETAHPFAASMEERRRTIVDSESGITEEQMMESIGEEQMEAFLDAALVRLVLSPEGSFTSYTMPGGELVSFKLGRRTVSTGKGSTLDENDWVVRSGEFAVPKRPQSVTLLVKAVDNEFQTKCFNEFTPSDEPVTFHMGLLEGVFCVGLVEDGG
jgi:hypothetical protein